MSFRLSEGKKKSSFGKLATVTTAIASQFPDARQAQGKASTPARKHGRNTRDDVNAHAKLVPRNQSTSNLNKNQGVAAEKKKKKPKNIGLETKKVKQKQRKEQLQNRKGERGRNLL